MMQNGMMFGGEGPIMSGNWYNPNTGDAFTVRDSFFEDNQYVVVTTDGRYLKYDKLQQYVSSDMKLEDLKKLKSEKKETKNEPLPESVLSILDNDSNPYADMMIPEDNSIIHPSNSQIGNIYKEQSSQSALITSREVQSHISMNHAIIEKALKNTDGPKLSVVLNWDNYPERQIEMLKDIMEISEDEIIEWYLDNITLDEVIKEFKNAIKERLRSNASMTPDLLCSEQPAETNKERKKSKKQ